MKHTLDNCLLNNVPQLAHVVISVMDGEPECNISLKCSTVKYWIDLIKSCLFVRGIATERQTISSTEKQEKNSRKSRTKCERTVAEQ